MCFHKKNKIHSNKAFNATTKGQRLKVVKEVFYDWSKRANVDGYSKIFQYERNKVAKMTWALIFLGSLGVTCWFISLNIIDYLKHDVVTTIVKNTEIPTPFPTITICNINPFTSRQAQNLFEDLALAQNITLSTANESELSLINELARMYAADPAYPIKSKISLGGFSTDEIDFCQWEYDKKLMGKNCAKQLHWYYSFLYGNCLQFNSGLSQTNDVIDLVTTSADLNGDDSFRIQIRPKYSNRYAVGEPFGEGFVVFVHNKSFEPTYEDALFVKQGNYNALKVKRTFKHKEPSPYSDCIDLTSYSSKLYDLIKK